MADAYTNQLKSYIKEQLDKGHEKKKVIKHLLKSGITKSQVRNALDALSSTARQPKKKSVWVYAGMTVSALILVLVFMIIYFSPTKCLTENCFVSKANDCMAATYTNKISGTTVYYETNNCVLLKTIKDMSAEEPKSVVNAFLSKSMRCRYNRNDFSPLFIKSITGHLEACEGPLKKQIIVTNIQTA